MNATQRVVRDTALLGLAFPVLAAVALADRGAIMPLRGGSTYAIVVLLVVVTIVANLVAVPVRRGEQVEELTLLESAVVASVLLLPAQQALWLPVVSIVLSCVITRRNPVKSLFNAANIAASSAVLVAAVHLVSAPGQGLSWRTVLGLLVGLAGFTVVNLLNLARVLAAAQELEARAVLADGWRLAVLTLPGHLSTRRGRRCSRSPSSPRSPWSSPSAPALTASRSVPARPACCPFRTPWPSAATPKTCFRPS